MIAASSRQLMISRRCPPEVFCSQYAGREIAECKSFTAYQKAYGNYFMAVSYDSMKKPELAAEQWEILSKCNVQWLVNLAKKNLKPVKK